MSQTDEAITLIQSFWKDNFRLTWTQKRFVFQVYTMQRQHGLILLHLASPSTIIKVSNRLSVCWKEASLQFSFCPLRIKNLENLIASLCFGKLPMHDWQLLVRCNFFWSLRHTEVDWRVWPEDEIIRWKLRKLLIHYPLKVASKLKGRSFENWRVSTYSEEITTKPAWSLMIWKESSFGPSMHIWLRGGIGMSSIWQKTRDWAKRRVMSWMTDNEIEKLTRNTSDLNQRFFQVWPKSLTMPGLKVSPCLKFVNLQLSDRSLISRCITQCLRSSTIRQSLLFFRGWCWSLLIFWKLTIVLIMPQNLFGFVKSLYAAVKVIEPFLEYLRQDIEAVVLARSATLGFFLGLCPIIGKPSFIILLSSFKFCSDIVTNICHRIHLLSYVMPASTF